MRIDAAAAREIEAAFAAAQARTRAPLVCVVAESSADYALAPALGAAVLALAAPWPLLAFAALTPAHIFLVQLVVFALGLGAVAFTPVRARLVSNARRNSSCHRAAVVQFAMRGLDRGTERNGVLLYVSLAERYARVVADMGSQVSQEAWRELIADLCMTMRGGESPTALKTAAERMGDLLGQAFPASPEQNAPKAQRFHVL
jgi:putative membrane protein